MKMLLTILTVLSSFLANLETKTLQSDFTVTVAEEVNAPMNYPGTLTMHGQLFRLSMFNIEAAYDGKTLYMYTPETDELTLSNPTSQELIEANPLLYAEALVPACNVTEKAANDGQTTLITLSPGASSRQTGGAASAEKGITKIVLRVRNSDLMPLQAEIKEGKKTSTLKFKDPKFITSEQKYELTPNKETYINDMRL